MQGRLARTVRVQTAVGGWGQVIRATESMSVLTSSAAATADDDDNDDNDDDDVVVVVVMLMNKVI